MKTLTKYSLILLATLSVSGCFQEDDKSYVEVGNVAENVVEEVIDKPATIVLCPNLRNRYFKKVVAPASGNTTMVGWDMEGHKWLLSTTCSVKFLKN